MLVSHVVKFELGIHLDSHTGYVPAVRTNACYIQGVSLCKPCKVHIVHLQSGDHTTREFGRDILPSISIIQWTVFYANVACAYR